MLDSKGLGRTRATSGQERHSNDDEGKKILGLVRGNGEAISVSVLAARIRCSKHTAKVLPLLPFAKVLILHETPFLARPLSQDIQASGQWAIINNLE